MPLEYQSDLYQFTLLFQSVKMKVKFPCKLSLEHGGTALTNQSSANQQNKFGINQEVTIKDQSEKKYIEIVVNLITEKGSKYIAGIIKLFHNQLLRSEGQRIVVALAKCLDSQAFCQVKVEKVLTQKITKRQPLMGTRTIRDQQGVEHSFSPAHHNNFKSLNQASNVFGTRSQAQFNTNKQDAGREWQQRNNQVCAMTYYPKNTKPSPPKTRRKIQNISRVKYSTSQRLKQDEQNTNRQKLIQAQVYKQNYQKLKQKYRKESENYKTELAKRIALQNNENNYKLQIVRLRLKCEELDKSYNDKNHRLRDAQAELAILQQKDIDINYYKQQTANLKNNLSMLEDTIIALNNQNQKLKDLCKERQHQYGCKMQDIQCEYQKLRTLYQNKQVEYDKNMRVMKQQLIQVEYELNTKSDLLQKQKNYIYDFQKNSQNKLFQFDTLLQNERNNFKLKLEDLKAKHQKSDLQNKQLNIQKKDLENQRENHKSHLMKTQYEYKLQLQQMNSLKNQLEQLQNYKENFQKLSLQFKSLKQEKQKSSKSYDKTLKSKEAKFEDIINEAKKESEFLKKVNGDLNQKNKSLQEKILQYQSFIEISKNNIEKHKRSLQSITKDFTQLKQKEKTIKKALSQKEEQIQDLKQKIEKTNLKQININETKRVEAQKMNQIISKLKIDLEAEMIKSAKLNENLSEISHQMSRVKMMLQFSQEKVLKSSISAQEKYKSYESIIQEHESVILILEQSINNLKIRSNDSLNEISMLKNENTALKDQYDRQCKQMKIFVQKLSTQQGRSKQKSNEFAAMVTKYEQSQKRNQGLQGQLHQIKSQLSSIKSQKQKTLKMLQIFTADNQKSRQTIVKLSAEIFDKDNQVEIKNKQFSKLQQEVEKSYHKVQTITRQYVKFKDIFSDLMKSSFKQYETLKHETNNLMNTVGGIPSSFQSRNAHYNAGKEWEAKFANPSSAGDRKSKFSSNQLSSKSFTDITSFTTQILTNFSNYSRQSQSTMSKLIQKNKILNKQSDDLKVQISEQINQNQQLKYQAQKQKQQIQNELRNITHQTGSQTIKLNSLIDEYKHRIYQKDQAIEELNSQLDELQFTMSSDKMDYDSSLNEIDKKNYHLKQIVEQLQEKTEFQHNVIASLEQRCYQSDRDMIDIKNSLVAEKEFSYKKQTQIHQLKQEVSKLEINLQNQKQKLSKLFQNLSSLQIQLTTEKQMKQKLEKMLTEEEDKKKELKAFSAHIIKEKQTIIKQQLEQHEKMTQMENRIHQIQQHKTLLLEEIQGFKGEISLIKTQNKRHQQTVKSNQKDLKATQNKLIQLQKLLKQRQRSIQQLQTKIKQKKVLYDSKQQQMKKSISELNEQIGYISNHKQKMTQGLSQKIATMQKQLQLQQISLNEQKNHINQIEELLYSQRQKCKFLQQNLIVKQQEINELRYRFQHLEASQHDLEQESKDKEENMYELSACIYELQSRISLAARAKQQQIDELNNQWNLKYDDIYQQFEQRFQLLEKEKQYLKQQIAQKQEEILKRHDEKKALQAQTQNIRKLLEQKIKKLEEERLALFTAKNSQIQKQSDEMRQLFETSKKKEAENRKLIHELDIARNQIVKLDARISEYDQKIKGVNKWYQQQLQQVKKKELSYKNFREQVISQQWNTQREIRKSLQNFIKSWLSLNDENRDKNQLMHLTKNLQTGIISAIKTYDQKP